MLKSIYSRPPQPDADLRLPGHAGRGCVPFSALENKPLHYGAPPPPRRRPATPSREELRRGVPETVIDPDNRVIVTDTRSYPYSAVCSLLMTDQSDKMFYGTGFLVGPKLVLTAGHNVYYGREYFMKQIVVYPGLNGDRAAPPFRAASSAAFATTEAWARDANDVFDIGAIFLPTDLGNDAGWFSVAKFTDTTLAGLTVNVSGYPKIAPDPNLPHDATTQWQDSSRLIVQPNRLLYTADTSEGQSGAPVFAAMPQLKDPYQAVAVHNTGFVTCNAGTRFDEAIFAQIREWRDKSQTT